MITKFTAGVDEVGRGAWAGPIVAAAVIIKKPIIGLKDSKRLSAKARLGLSEIIKKEAFCWYIAELNNKIIDEIGIGEANRLVMRMAIDGLSVVPSSVKVDGFSCKTNIPESVIIHGDDKEAEISAASIIAKVYRDNLMEKMHEIDTRYGYNKHVGYGTKLHLDMLKLHGPSEFHRFSYKPIKQLEDIHVR